MFLSKDFVHAQAADKEKETIRTDTRNLRQVVELKISKKAELGLFSTRVEPLSGFHPNAVNQIVDELRGCGYEVEQRANMIFIKW